MELHPNNAFENGRSQAALRALAHADQRGRSAGKTNMESDDGMVG